VKHIKLLNEGNTMDFIALLIQIVVGIIFIAPVLWLAGRALAGKDKAKFTDALWIVVLGIVIGAVVSLFNLGWIIAAIIMLIVWLALIKHFFDCGWLKALAIAIIAVIIFIIIIAVLAIIGFGILTWLF
jgi:hypothetical protein